MFIAGLVLILLGLLFVIYYVKAVGNAKKHTAQTIGTVIKKGIVPKSDPSMDNSYYYDLSYKVDGLDYELKHVITIHDTLEEGDKYTIYYDPNRPKDADANEAARQGNQTAVLILGLIVTVVGAVLVIL